MDQKIANLIDYPILVCNNLAKILLLNNNINALWNTNIDTTTYNNLTLTDIFEMIREAGNYPEPENFREHINYLLNIAKNYTNYSKINKLILQNGKYIQEHIIKQNNLLLISWHDVSEQTTLNQSLIVQKNIFNKIINYNSLATIIVTNSGIIDEYNYIFSQLFNISKDILNTKPNIKDILHYISSHNTTCNNILNQIFIGKSFNENYDDININAISLQNNCMWLNFTKISSNNSNTSNIITNSLVDLSNNLTKDLHSIMQPNLNNIFSLANILKDELVGKLNIRQMEYIKTILNETEAIKDQLNYKNQLIALSKPIDLNKEPVNLNIILANIINWLKPSLVANNVNIVLQINNLHNNININNTNFSKMLHLSLLYIILQNNNSDIIVEVTQNNNYTNIYLKDTAKAVLFSQYELDNSYNVKLILHLANLLNCTVKYFYKNRSFRVLHFKIIY